MVRNAASGPDASSGAGHYARSVSGSESESTEKLKTRLTSPHITANWSSLPRDQGLLQQTQPAVPSILNILKEGQDGESAQNSLAILFSTRPPVRSQLCSGRHNELFFSHAMLQKPGLHPEEENWKICGGAIHSAMFFFKILFGAVLTLFLGQLCLSFRGFDEPSVRARKQRQKFVVQADIEAPTGRQVGPARSVQVSAPRSGVGPAHVQVLRDAQGPRQVCPA